MTLLIKGGGKLVYDEDNAIEVPKDETPAYLEWTLWRAAWRLITWSISRMKSVDSNWILTLCLFRLLAVAKAICIANLTILPF